MVTLRILCAFVCITTAQVDMKKVRNLYQQAPFSEAKAAELMQLLTMDTQAAPTLLGYKGAARMVMSKHAYNPYTKLRYFREGRSELERAIDRDRDNIELRYLRYTIQLNSPAFLEYAGNMAEDKRFLEQRLGTISDSTLKFMVYSLLHTAK